MCVCVLARALCVVRATEIRKGCVWGVGCVCVGGGVIRMGVCYTEGRLVGVDVRIAVLC